MLENKKTINFDDNSTLIMINELGGDGITFIRERYNPQNGRVVNQITMSEQELPHVRHFIDDQSREGNVLKAKTDDEEPLQAENWVTEDKDGIMLNVGGLLTPSEANELAKQLTALSQEILELKIEPSGTYTLLEKNNRGIVFNRSDSESFVCAMKSVDVWKTITLNIPARSEITIEKNESSYVIKRTIDCITLTKCQMNSFVEYLTERYHLEETKQ